jgi:hypothetical protein
LKTARRQCIFCLNQANTKEHVWPKWVLAVVDQDRPLRFELGSDPEFLFSGEFKIGCVCGDCNNGWMSRLEDEVKPCLEPMLHGSITPLTRSVQEKLSLWAVKIAMVMGAPLIEAASSVESAPPVLRFVLLELGIIFALSVVAFAVADDLSRAALSVWIPLMAAICALPFLLYYADRTRKIFKHLAIIDEAVRQAGKRLLRQGIVFALLFMITASIVGYAVGNSGRETQQLITDVNLQVSLANRIGDQRKSAVKIVPAQIAMYDKLETDVRAYASVCKKLQGDWTVYDGKYPASHKTTETSLHDVEIEVKRADLLLKQIQVARQLRSINDADQQWAGWQNDMQPLLDEENALD